VEESVTENDETAGLPIQQPSDEARAALPPIPEELAILPLFNVVIYPLTVIPLAVGQEQSIQLIDEAVLGERMIGLVTLKNEQERPEHVAAEDYYQIGTAAVVQGIERIELVEITATEPYIRARVRVVPDETSDDIETQALMRNLVNLAQQILQLLPNPSEELQTQIINEDDPRRLAYLLAVSLLFRSSVAERQEVLALPTVRAKLSQLSTILTRELSVLQLGRRCKAGSTRASASTCCASNCAPSARSLARATRTPPRSSACARRSSRPT
jgi:ATP-dependent Lon protease